MAITLRSVKGSGLTNAEIDANFTTLDVRDLSGGVAGLTGFALNVWNAAKTFKSLLSFAGTANRSHVLPDKSGTVALTSDITGGTSAGSFTTLSASGDVTLAANVHRANDTGNITINGGSGNSGVTGGQVLLFGNSSASLPGKVLIDFGTTAGASTLFRDGAGSTKAEISSTGLAVTGEVTANGLTFPATQVDSANANTLDDYEEGSWTPAIYHGATLAGIYNVGGTYTKVGRLVTCYMSAYINHGAGALRIEGLPFTAANTTQPNGWFGSSARDLAAGVSSTGAVGVGSASCNFDYSFAGWADCDIRACIVYQV